MIECKEKTYRKKFSEAVLKKLFALSGNECAMPSCEVKLIYEDSNETKGIICHIEAASEYGPRYNPEQSELQRHSFENLILLCPNCHRDIDTHPDKFSVDLLKKYKKNHESKFKDKPYHVPKQVIIDPLEKINIVLDETKIRDKGARIFVDQDFDNLIDYKKENETNCWEIIHFEYSDIVNNYDVRRNYIDTISESIKQNKGTMIIGEPYSGKTNIIKRLIVELSKNYIIVLFENSVDIPYSKLLSDFIKISKSISNSKLLIVVDNLDNRNAIEFIKFYNEFDNSQVRFLFSAKETAFRLFREGLTHDQVGAVDNMMSHTNKISILLTEDDCLLFVKKIFQVYEKTLPPKIDSRYLLDASRHDLFNLLWFVKHIAKNNNLQEFDEMDYIKHAESDYNELLIKIESQNCWKEAMDCLLMSALGIIISKNLIRDIKIDYSIVNRLINIHFLFKDGESFVTRHEVWAYIFLNYILNNYFHKDIDAFVDKYPLDKRFQILLKNFNKNDLIITIIRIGLITRENFLLGQRIIDCISLDGYSDHDKSEIFCYGYAMYYRTLGNRTLAEKYYLDAIKLNNKNYVSYNNLGTLYEENGVPEKAEEIYEIAISKEAILADIYYNYARLLTRKDPTRALELIFRSIELDDRYPYSYSTAGSILSELGEVEEAEMFYKVALSINEFDHTAFMGLGNLLRRQFIKDHEGIPIPLTNLSKEEEDRVSEILTYYDKVLSIENDNFEAWWSLGRTYREIGLYSRSITCLDKAFKLRNDVEILIIQMSNYKESYQPLNKMEKLLNKILELDPDNPLALKNLSILGKIKDKPT